MLENVRVDGFEMLENVVLTVLLINLTKQNSSKTQNENLILSVFLRKKSDKTVMTWLTPPVILNGLSGALPLDYLIGKVGGSSL